jgi:hypothetical protein
VRVIVPPSFPKGDGAEYATYRTYQVVLECVVPDTRSRLIHYSESYEFSGTGGPDWGFMRPLEGELQAQMFTQKTEVRLVQSGTAVGNDYYPLPPGPVYPKNEHEPSRRIRRDLPSPGKRERITSWSYVFLGTFATGIAPTIPSNW